MADPDESFNPKALLSQFGLKDLPGIGDDGDMDSDPDDDTLEAELQAILSGKEPPKRNRPKTAPVDVLTIEQMAAQAVKDVSDDEGDENLSGDEELVAELMKISKSSSPSPDDETKKAPPQPQPRVTRSAPPVPAPRKQDVGPQSLVATLEERLQMYKAAEAEARNAGNSGKARRYGRAIKTLEGQVKAARAGRPVDESEIPPPVAIPKAPPAEAPPREEEPEPAPVPKPAPTPVPTPAKRPSMDEPDDLSRMLTSRRDQYKVAALQAKRSGDTATAVKYVRIAKQFDAVIEAHAQGQPIDLSNMPPPPPLSTTNVTSGVAVPSAPVAPPPPEPVVIPEGIHIPGDDEVPDASLFGAPPPPSTVLEGLEQRLAKFRSTMDEAQAAGNASKAKRIGRIVKQYENAVKLHKAGKPVDYDELPVPPGFGPLPIAEEPPRSAEPKGSAPVPATQPKPAPAQPRQPQPNKTNRDAPVTRQASVTNRMTKQLEFLVERQRLFREAALEAKKQGEIEQAKEYLRMAKGIEPMIQGTRSGLPVNISSIPTPPQLTEDFVVVDRVRPSVPGIEGDPNELFRKLEVDLTKQIEICLKNKDHFMQLGDVASVSKFENLAHDTHKDLDVIRNLWDRGDPLPKFHYENRVFSIVVCNTDLSNNELELTVVRGIDLPGKPTDLDSYVRVEFPYPTDAGPRVKTHTVKDTNNPTFNATFKFDINRKSRSFARIVKKHAIKLEVWSKGGFLRSDSLLGTVNVKLADLETKCTVHDCYDLMQNRKPCGGKIEAKMRIRDPFLAKQIEEVREKWLVIGS